MIKKIIAGMLALFAAAAFAAVDANKATQAELEAIKGVGPAIATKIIDERKKGTFKDWNDMVERVKGVGEGNAAKFSTEGLTVNGAGFKGAAPAAVKPAAKADDKKAAPAVAAAPAPAAVKVEEKKAAPAAAAAPASAAAPAMAKVDDKKAAAEAKKKEKADKKAAKAAMAADAKASAAKK